MTTIWGRLHDCAPLQDGPEHAFEIRGPESELCLKCFVLLPCCERARWSSHFQGCSLAGQNVFSGQNDTSLETIQDPTGSCSRVGVPYLCCMPIGSKGRLSPGWWGSVGWSIVPFTKKSWVQSPDGAHTEGNSSMFLSLSLSVSLSLPLSLKAI